MGQKSENIQKEISYTTTYELTVQQLCNSIHNMKQKL